MILLAGLPDEPPMALVREALEDSGAPFHMFDQRGHAESEIIYGVDQTSGMLGGTLRLGDGAPIDLGQITSIYHRMHGAQSFEDLAAGPSDRPDVRRFNDLVSRFTAFCDAFEGRVMNRSPGMVTNNSKPLQAQIIARNGFLVPKTLITNSRTRALDFIAANAASGKETIYKSASSVRSIVKTITARDVEKDLSIRACPVQFQERVEGEDYRVHVVGEEIFASRIATSGVDYRYANRDPDGSTEIFEADVPADVRKHAVKLAKALDLMLAGIDLRRTPEGAWYCFEVNPSPAFSYYEAHTGQPIAAAIAAALAPMVDE